MDNHDVNDDGHLEEKKLECDNGLYKPDARPKYSQAEDTRTSAEASSESFDHFRMETAWAQAEAEYSNKNSNAKVPQSLVGDSDSYNISPLMARVDSTNNTSTCFGCEVDGQNKQGDDILTTRLTQQPSVKLSIVQRYRHFLQKHEPSLDIVERIMERFVFYRYLFNHDHSGMKIELYYAAWNIIRWVNDVVLMGWGDGMGVTAGSRNEWLGRKTESSATKAMSTPFQEWALPKMHVIVPVLRAILTAISCVYPALEAWSRKPMLSRPTIHGTPISYDDSRQQEEWEYATTSDLCPKARRLQWEIRQGRAAGLSHRVERIRFVTRLALLSISWWARHQRRQNNKEKSFAVPSLLRRGGDLDPCEELLPLEAVDTAAAVSEYKGKRTGRRSISTPATSKVSSTVVAKGHSLINSISDVIKKKQNIIYFHILGELLHILRPFYWSRCESIEWKSKTSSSVRKYQHNSVSPSSLWKSWLLSLIMDIVSDEILDITTGCKTQQAGNRNSQKRPSFFSRSTERNTSYSSLQPVIQSEQDELAFRRSRRAMYLLRSPVYKAITLPVMTAATKIISKVPSFGLGRWASEYILDMLSYWNEHRFMLE